MSLDNIEDERIAEELNITIRTVGKWQQRFKEKGIEGLNDAPRSGRPPDFDVKDRCEVIAIACDCPKNYGHETHESWTIDLLTETVNKEISGLKMSRSSVVRTLMGNELRPHKFRPWLHSKDPKFTEKVNEIIDLYVNVPDNDVVLCVDEKPMQANEHKNEIVMPQRGKAGKKEYEYIRHGTQALIAGFDIRTGEVLAGCQDTRKAEDILIYMDSIAKNMRAEEKYI